MAHELTKANRVEHLDHCPMCHYSLIGLPSVHRCPKCNLAYDNETLVITRWSSRWGNPVLRAQLLLGMIPMSTVVKVAMGRGRIDYYFWICLIISLVFIPSLFISWVREFRFPPMVIVNPDGVLLRASETPRTYTWEEITDVTFHPMHRKGAAICFLICGATNISLQAFMTTWPRSQAFLIAVKARLAEKAAKSDRDAGNEALHG